jgi:hypothetical protein
MCISQLKIRFNDCVVFVRSSVPGAAAFPVLPLGVAHFSANQLKNFTVSAALSGR